jgi:hypothetical protein
MKLAKKVAHNIVMATVLIIFLLPCVLIDWYAGKQAVDYS